MIATSETNRYLAMEREFRAQLVEHELKERCVQLDGRAVAAEQRLAEQDEAVAVLEAEHHRLRESLAVLERQRHQLSDAFAFASAERDVWRERAGAIRQECERQQARADINERQILRLRVADRHRVRALIAEVVNGVRAHGQRLGVFGSGAHTEWLLRETTLSTIPQLWVFDSDPAACGRTIAGTRVRPVTELAPATLDAVIVSSLAFQDEMTRFLESQALEDVRIIRCYP